MSSAKDYARSVVDASRVQGFIRLLSELRTGAVDARPMPRASIVKLMGASGTLATLGIDPEFLAGKGRVAVVGDAGEVVRVGVCAEDLGALLRPEALAEWRSKSLLPWAPERSNSLLLRRGENGVAMSKIGTGWLMSAPMKVKADAGAAQGVALWLANAAIDRFVDDAAPKDAFAIPGRVIVIATESNDRRRIEQRIELGPELDPRSSLVRITAVEADRERATSEAGTLWGPVVAVVQTSLLAGLSDDPSAYVLKTSFDFPAADVVAVRIGAAVTARGGDGGFGDQDATLRSLLKLLTEVPAASIVVLPQAAVTGTDSTDVTLLGLGNATIGAAVVDFDSIASRTEGMPPTPAVRVTVDRIQRVIPLERAREFLATLKAIERAR